MAAYVALDDVGDFAIVADLHIGDAVGEAYVGRGVDLGTALTDAAISHRRSRESYKRIEVMAPIVVCYCRIEVHGKQHKGKQRPHVLAPTGR